MTENGEQWVYDVGDRLVRRDIFIQHPSQSEIYTVKRRLVDEDSGELFYYVEWEEDGGRRRQLKVDSVIHDIFRAVDADIDHEADQ